jgi:hypothetical protein
MVQINGRNFNVYDLDSYDSILSRIASVLDTLPLYLYFPEGKPNLQNFFNDTNIVVEDLFEQIKTGANSLQFEPLYNKIEPKLNPPDKKNPVKISTERYILEPFVAYNKGMLLAPEGFSGSMLLVIIKSVERLGVYSRIPNLDEIWENRERIKALLQKSIDNNKDRSKSEVILFSQFDKVGSSQTYLDFNITPFELQKEIFELVLDLNNISLMELFNNFELNTSVPFATVNNFYKILKDFIPPSEWSGSLEGAIIIKVLERANLLDAKITDFTDALISIEGEPGNEVVTTSLNLSTSGNNLSRQDFIDRFLGTLPSLGTIKIKSLVESQVNGVFYFPMKSLDKYVFSDLVMNNPLFSGLLAINESDKASKQKIYVHFNHPKIGYVTANITERIVMKGDYARESFPGLFKSGARYIRVKVSKAKNTTSVVGFQKTLAKLFVIYEMEYDKIVTEYRKFIPDFGKIEPIIIKNKEVLKLKDIAPDIFLPNYSRKCPKKPTIITDEDAKIAKENGKEVIVFPKPGEGSIPRNYVCNHDTHSFPGLRVNPLENKKTFPYIPCCYKKNQSLVKGSKLRHYYFGEELPIKEITQQELYITNKFVPVDTFGTLPKNITKMFRITDPDDKYMYIRKGVQRGKTSFLHCVLEAIGDENIRSLIDKDEIEAYLFNIRDNMSSEKWAATCRQEMYDSTSDEIMKHIKNPDIYFDPNRFVALLEAYYKCNIFIFTRHTLDGEMSIPRHLQAYYKNKKPGNCIFIFEHNGSESDHSEYPQCELIGKWKVTESENVKYLFDYNNNISLEVRKIAKKVRKAYKLDDDIPDINFPLKDMKLLGQGIDSYGKCRMVQVKYNGFITTLFTTPIQPLIAPELPNWEVFKISQEDAIDFAKSLGIVITKQTVENDILKELHGILGNVDVDIPVKDGSTIDGIPIFNGGLSFPDRNKSAVRVYNEKKKLSRYIVEYMYWLFSIYMEKEKKVISNKTIVEFQKSMIKINKDFKYGIVQKAFSLTGGVMESGKLVVPSEETLKRLMYMLRLTTRRYKDKIISYKNRTSIENFYVDIADFSQYSQQVILDGEESVDKWIQERKIKYNITNKVIIGVKLPYFFKNELVGDQIYLAQNTDTIESATKIAKTWFTQQYNPGESPGTTTLVEYSLYSYTSSIDIKLYKVEGPPTVHDIRVLGYKIEETNFFTILLPFKMV